MHHRPRFQLLCLQPVGDSNGLWLRRPWLDRLLLLLLLLSLLLRPHLRLLLCHGLFAEPLYIFLDRYAELFCLGCELHLDLSNLLGCRLLAVGALDVDGQPLWLRGPLLWWPLLRWLYFVAHGVRWRSRKVGSSFVEE
jgi:hypothetical protein